MSVLKEAVAQSGHAQAGRIDLKPLNLYFWRWFHNNKQVVLVRKKVLIVKITVKVADLKGLFTDLFGDDPFATGL